MSAWPFSALEVSADASERDIRRAYARKLKTVHPEDDPEGFKALREAYEAAMSGRWSPQAAEFAHTLEEEPVAPAADAPPTTAPTFVPQSRSHEEELWDLQQELLRRLQDGEASDDEREDALDAVLASPALENVGRMAQVEAWVGGLLAENPGVTDALLDRAIRRFRWDRDRRWDMPWYVAAALARLEALGYVRRLRDPADGLHAGYRLLQRPPRNGLSVFFKSGRVRRVLELIDAEPGVRPEFDYEIVERWREALDRLPFHRPRGRRSPWRFAFLILWMAFMLYKCVDAVSPDEPVTGRAPEVVASEMVEACRRAARAPALMPDAERLCVEAETTAGDRIAIRNDRALVYLRQENWTRAEEVFASVLDRSPNDARALFGRGMAHYKMAYSGLGAPYFERALAIDAAVAEEFARYGFPLPDGINAGAPGSARAVIDVAAGSTYIRPIWAGLPDQDQMTRFYPAQALKRNLQGRVELDCAVRPSGVLTGCIVAEEQPQDAGFADSALQLSSFYGVDTGKVALPPLARVRIAMNFQVTD